MKTIFYNGSILTMEEPCYAQAVLVEDGIIREVGDSKKVLSLKDSSTELRDLEGKALLPGFIDSHSHITSFSATLVTLALSGAKSFEDIACKIADFIADRQLKPDEWVTGFGYDHNFLAEKSHPNRQLLDKAAPNNPVVIAHASGHMGVMNTRALELMGIGSTTANPQGGIIGREKDGTTPNGYLEETAFTSTSAKLPQPTMDELCSRLQAAQQVYLSHGITTIQDGFTQLPQWAMLSQAACRGLFIADVVCYPDLAQCRSIVKENAGYVRTYRHRLKIGGYKIFLDGSPQGRTAWMTQPYLGDKKDYCGYPIHPDEDVRGMMEEALGDGMQLLAHCNGDAAAQQMIDAYDAARRAMPLAPDIRPVMIHAQLLRQNQLPAMAALGMIASFFVAHTYYWGDVHLKNFGPQRANTISPAKSALEHGVTYTFHQDSPVLPPDMLDTLQRAVCRVTKNGAELAKEERLTTLEALRGITINAARQYFEEDKKGSIAPGKQADFVVLDRDPLITAPQELSQLRVLETIKDGKTVFLR